MINKQIHPCQSTRVAVASDVAEDIKRTRLTLDGKLTVRLDRVVDLLFLLYSVFNRIAASADLTFTAVFLNPLTGLNFSSISPS